jgi:hypothetical protein
VLVFLKPGRIVDNLLGDVNFERGMLISASKDSGLGDQQEGVRLARTLYSEMYALTNGENRPCIVSTWQSQNIVNAQVKGITIRCGKRYVELHVVHPDDDRPSIGVRQSLSRD